jgi:hypothetical protein
MARPREPRKIIVEPAGTLPVRLEEKPPEPFRWREFLRNPAAWVLAFLSVTSLLIWWLSGPVCIVLTCGPQIAIHLEYPRWLSTGDEGVLRLTLQNETSDPLTGTVALHFLGPLPVQLEKGQTTRLEVQGLPSLAAAGYTVAFQIHSAPTFFRSGSLRFSVRWTTADSTALCRTSDGAEVFRVSLAPIHGLQELSRWLRSSPLSLVALALWEWVKKRILKEE